MKIILITFAALIFLSCPLIADEPISPYFNQPQFYPYLEYAINCGLLHVDHPLNQPYIASELHGAIASQQSDELPAYQRAWLSLLSREVNRFYQPDSTRGYWHLGANGYGRLIRNDEDGESQTRVELHGMYSLPYFVMVNRLVSDKAFESDPHYYGAVSYTHLTLPTN